MSSAIDTVVFLGPTLSVESAKQIFPEACYHAPAQCGDIFRVLRLCPKKIVLIDGLFETVMSVWHKELLFALEKGVVVYGASSMGALRAAELAPFGVIGVGKIFRDFTSSTLDNDDAVAVLHADQSKDYAPINEPLTDFQATLEAAFTAKAISLAQKNDLFSVISSWFYPDRSLSKVAAKAKEDPALFQSFYAWIQQNGLVFQKRLDAIEALNRARTEEKSIRDPFEVPKTIFFRRQARKINLSIFQKSYEWLPSEEQELISLAQNRPQFFKILIEAAFAFSICCDLACSDSVSLEKSWLEETDRWVLSQVAKRKERVHPYFSFFAELFECNPNQEEKNGVYLFSLLFLAADRFLDRFPSPYDHRPLSYLENRAKSHCDIEKVHQVSKKYAIEPRRIFRFYSVFETENLSSIKKPLFDSINWLILVKEKAQKIHRKN